MRGVLASLCLAAAAPAEAQDAVFSIHQTRVCLQSAEDPADRRACIGASAMTCMDSTPGGHSTMGQNDCLGRELEYWDGRLNVVYQALRDQHRAEDAEIGELPGVVPQAIALRDMQRAWIAFRDATCAYERAQWTNGSGAGPAWLWCMMYQTAEQTMYLERMRNDF